MKLLDKTFLSLTAADLMSRPVEVIAQETSLRAAAHLLSQWQISGAPVVDEAGRPVGVLSVKRIVHYLVEHFPGTVYNLPPDPDAVQHEREGA